MPWGEKVYEITGAYSCIVRKSLILRRLTHISCRNFSCTQSKPAPHRTIFRVSLSSLRTWMTPLPRILRRRCAALSSPLHSGLRALSGTVHAAHLSVAWSIRMLH